MNDCDRKVTTDITALSNIHTQYKFYDISAESLKNSRQLWYSFPVKGSIAEVDWDFLDGIYENRDFRPHPIPEEERTSFTFEAEKYHDAVIMPWYRNQDQPQVSLIVSYFFKLSVPSVSFIRVQGQS